MATPTNQTGRITQVIGAVVDVQFEGELPAILNALETKIGQPSGSKSPNISAIDRTYDRDGYLRASWPGGHRHRPADRGAGRRRDARAHHQRGRRSGRRGRQGALAETRPDSPGGAEILASRPSRILSTGIKVVDLLAPYAKGGKVACSAALRRQDRHHSGVDQQHRQGPRRLFGVRRVGERTRENNDLIMSSSIGVNRDPKKNNGSTAGSKCALVFGQMNERRAPRARQADRPHGR
jgi:F-type H+-transporting ATPase subunit beta